MKKETEMEAAERLDNSGSPYSDRNKFPRISYNPSRFKYPEHEEAHRTWLKEHEQSHWGDGKGNSGKDVK